MNLTTLRRFLILSILLLIYSTWQNSLDRMSVFWVGLAAYNCGTFSFLYRRERARVKAKP